ncbi:hypothetical protein K437DRAFT_244341 [Tilletiaria anomala UBC 951]|uniref:Nudix hydrolase domain-containing protein n=1 Tax=Tilletiaria anomala (strain ATCC 24038 / CBS 436.72 / UBC 951) TaxID=1037660 RepID=A0A066WDG3_TILAU|nr:uncharacterized protein K437DRAFT_244341 [Tilletiaria anomala UBC 951]KDN51962.1 hypothetical protein K437DRAFT_244341 [Tilletiaria anomala UBC 951]
MSSATPTAKSKAKTNAIQPRHVAVAIPYRYDSVQSQSRPQGDLQICLVTSRKHDGLYVLPKGGVEAGESSSEAAIREMWEEAGLRPAPSNHHSAPVDSSGLEPSLLRSNMVADHKPHKFSPSADPLSPAFVPRAIYTAHEFEIKDSNSSSAVWPESRERQRKWVSLKEAKEGIRWRKDIAELLDRSTLGGY